MKCGSRFVLCAPVANAAVLSKLGAVKIGETIAEGVLDIGLARFRREDLFKVWSETLPRIANGEH